MFNMNFSFFEKIVHSKEYPYKSLLIDNEIMAANKKFRTVSFTEDDNESYF
jgi:hypothetical protein